MPFTSKNPFKTLREAQVMTSIHQGGEWGDGGGGSGGGGEIVKLCGSVLLTEGVKEYIINLLFQLFVSCLTTCY